MRYTTVIDVTEIPQVWGSPNVTRIYLYMVLKCGYHDEDRDMISVSIRNLAWRTGLTVSATRHALGVLQSYHLIERSGLRWRVVKWLEDAVISKRKTRKEKTSEMVQQERIKAIDKIDEERRSAAERDQELSSQGLSQLILTYEDFYMKAGKGSSVAAQYIKVQRQNYIEDCHRLGHKPIGT